MDPETQRKLSALQGKIALLKGLRIDAKTQSDINWFDKEELDRGIRNFSRGDYADIVGKQANSLTNQHRTHGLPVAAGAPLDLTEILRWFDAFLTRVGRKYNGKTDKPGLDDQAIERAEKREQLDMQSLELKFKILQADFEKKAGNAISSDEVEKLFAWFEGELRKLGERLGKRFGAESQELFNNTLDRIGRHLEELMPR